MAVLKNRTQKNFTMISNNVLRDPELSMKDREVLCTIFSLPDGWNFSIAGLSALVPDGVDSIRASVLKLEEMGYIVRIKTRGRNGKYTSEIEVFTEKQSMRDLPSRENRHGCSTMDSPSRVGHDGEAIADNPMEYNTDNTKQIINTDNGKSINLSSEDFTMDREEENNGYKKLIAKNIDYECLLETASSQGEDEVQMVREIYDLICDMVCYPRKSVWIKGIEYSWQTVKSQFLKLRYQNIANILNRVVDQDLGIKNMSGYLISMLYTESLAGILEAQAKISDGYLKYLRGNPY